MQSTKPPDPQATANAQFGSNVKSAVASAWLANPNQSSPVGTWKNKATSYRTIDGQKVPQFTQSFTFAPGQKTLYNQNLQLGRNMNDIARRQLRRLDSSLAQPIDFSGAPELAGNFDNYRSEVEAGLISRLEPQLQRDENAARVRLANSGLTQGSEAWNREMDRLDRSKNDARTQVMLASGGEARAAGGYQNQARQQYINELMAQRNQPLNEITALTSGGQVAQPGQPNWAGYGVAAPDITGNIYNSSAQQNAQNNAAMGGLFGLGGTLAGGLFGF